MLLRAKAQADQACSVRLTLHVRDVVGRSCADYLGILTFRRFG